MFKFRLSLFFLFAIVTRIAAQDSLHYDVQKNNGINYPIESVLIINADEIKRYPSNNFLSAVEGIFPGIFGTEVQVQHFSFVVDGFMLSDINGIDLNDIQTIAFSRSNVYGGMLPFSTQGTFFITTKKAPGKKTIISFNSKQSISLSYPGKLFSTESSSYPNTIIIQNEFSHGTGYFSGNHLSVEKAGDKYKIHAGGYFNKTYFPAPDQTFILKNTFDSLSRVMDASSKGSENNYGVFVNADYSFSSKITAGINANYAHVKFDSDSSFLQYYNSFSNQSDGVEHAALNLVNVAGYLNWKPTEVLDNKLSIEYNRKGLEINDNWLYQSLGTSLYKTKRTGLDQFKTNAVLIKDELKYHVLQKSNFQTDVILNSFWFKTNTKDQSNVSYVSDGNISQFQSMQQKMNEEIIG